MKKIIIAVGAFALAAGALTACTSQSDTASQNISTDAENFKIERDIVLYNSITDKYIAEIVGRCSVDSGGDGLPAQTLAVTCKIGADKFSKAYFGKSDNVVWFELQQKPVQEDVYHYKVVFKPEEIIPNLQINTSGSPISGDAGPGVQDKSGGVTPTPTPAG